MPEQRVELALAFLESHPVAAATILEQLSPADVVALLANIPERISAPVLERMLPQYTARLCKLMPAERSAKVLADMNSSIVAAILRHSNQEIRKQILEHLPEKTKLTCLFLLNYPEDTAGAWMIVQATSVAVDYSVAQALKILVEQEDFAQINTIFVVDRERRLQGELTYATLLRANPEAAVSALMETRTPVVLGRTNLETVDQLEVWEQRESIAIINRQNLFVGVLRHVDLRRGLAQVANKIEPPIGSDPITSILSVYGNSLFSLLDTLIAP